MINATAAKPPLVISAAADIDAYVAAHPRTCYRVLDARLSRALRSSMSYDDPRYSQLEKYLFTALMAARPECGYRCDGDEGPHPVNGSPGCFYSGRCED